MNHIAGTSAVVDKLDCGTAQLKWAIFEKMLYTRGASSSINKAHTTVI